MSNLKEKNQQENYERIKGKKIIEVLFVLYKMHANNLDTMLVGWLVG